MAVSMCSVTSQREPSSVTSGSEYLKRPLQHDVETDFEPAVKMKCPSGTGGGRRKQSKPIRVRSDVEPVEDLVVDMKLSVAESPSHLSDSSEACRDGQTVGSFEEPEPAGVFPTKYHQLGRELKQEVGLTSYSSDAVDDDVDAARSRSELVDNHRTDLSDVNRPPPHDAADVKSWNHFPDSFYQSSQGSQQSSMSKSDCFPTNLSMRPVNLDSPGNSDEYLMQSSGRAVAGDVDMSRADVHDAERFWEGSDAGSGAEKSRIFHPDAYCDICDREFCNKYFLKTHRANKHGIYDGSSTDQAGYSSSAVPPAMSGLVFSQVALPGVEPPTVSVSDRERPTSSLVSCSSASSLSSVLPIPQLPSNLGMLPYDDAPPPPPTRSTDMEDYCEICQKHFCNKYYLRKHRQDVHGLSPGDVVARRSQADFTHVSSDSAEPSSTAHFPLRVSSSASSSSLPPPSALSNFPMFLPPPFGAPLPVVPPFLHGAGGLGFSSLPFGGDGVSNSSKLSTSSSSQPQSQQQLLPGMMSADTYLDMFRKELLGGYLMNNGDRDVTAAIAAVAAAAASGSDTSVSGPAPPPPRLPSLPTGSEPCSAPVTSDMPTPDTFAEMLQRIGARIGKKNDGLGSLQHDLLRLNGLGAGAMRLPGSLASTPSSSSSSSSSRLVDRVVCDLCNKEVCNKYFLKTHKMKVHGWDPNTSTVPSNVSTSLLAAESAVIKSEPQSQPPLMYLPPLPVTQVDQPLSFPPPESLGLTSKEAELQKMGIDPEAYCEICRKEFCSKYFLRTHRQNIHGIQDAATSSTPASYQTPITSLFSSAAQPFSAGVLPPPAPPLISLPSSLSTNCSTSSSSSSMFLFSESSAPGDLGHMSELRAWKWKEPVNATRVSCTLCNKVLCNKYFLKTHMAKRHGINVDTRVQPPYPAPPPPPPVRDVLHPPSNGVAQFGPEVADVDHKDTVESSTDGGKTGAVNLVMPGRTLTDVQTVTARTWQIPASVTPPHNDPVMSASDEPVKCPLCTTAMSDREVLLRHLTSVHQVDEQMSMSLVAAVGQSDTTGSPSSTLLDGSNVRPPTMSSGGAVMRRRRQFRCTFCRERFRTRVHCELHARAAHPRASGSCVEVTSAVENVDKTSPPLSTSGCQPVPIYATPLDANDAGRTQMLPFVLRESLTEDDQPHFPTALVYLPTFRPLTSPTNVTFTLTPIVQP